MKAKLFTIAALMLLAHIGRSQQVQLSFKVIDDFDRPVANASVILFTYKTTEKGEAFGQDVYDKMTGMTDTNGMVTLSGSTPHSDIRYGVAHKDGYYDTEPANFQFNRAEGGKWQPWNPKVEIVFRPVINPVAMIARKIEARIGAPHRVYGYDLQAGDRVAPDGKGKSADLFLELTGYANSVTDYDSTLTISFPNALDGIQPFVVNNRSAFRSPREAPRDGYEHTLEIRRVRSPALPRSKWVDDTIGGTNYFFRIRTTLDEHGKIKSALYGKIYGGFKFFGASTNGSFLTIPACYLNLAPNSRNMEFDPAQNLFKTPKPAERASAP